MSKPVMEVRKFDLAPEVRAGDDGSPRIVGYAAVFDSLSDDLGGFQERISVGAFTRALRDKPDVRALINHDPNLILGRTKSGTLTLAANQKGLLYTVDPPDTQYARDLQASMKRGDVDQSSFAFRTVKDEWNVENGIPTRTLLDVDVFDVSVVTYPAYPDTESSLRSVQHALESFARWREEARPKGIPVDLTRRMMRLLELID